MTIALWHPVDGFEQYERYALIEDGAVVEGEYYPPPEVDLTDEDALLARYTGPGLVASRLDESGGTAAAGGTRGSNFECSICGFRKKVEAAAGDDQHWMPCPECEKDRFFDREEGGE
jgi:hypothetical protein